MTRDILTPVIFQVASDEGEIDCKCGSTVDLEEASTANEARELWNQHIRKTH